MFLPIKESVKEYIKHVGKKNVHVELFPRQLYKCIYAFYETSVESKLYAQHEAGKEWDKGTPYDHADFIMLVRDCLKRKVAEYD